MIESLTPQQEAKLSTYRERWIQIILNTEPCNVPQTKRWINRIYQQAGLEPPKEYKLFDSPLSCAEYAAEANLNSPLRNQTHDKINNLFLPGKLNQISNQAWNQVRDQIWNPLFDRERLVLKLIMNQIYEQVGNKIRRQIENQVGNHHYFIWGCSDFFLKELKLNFVKPLIPLINLAKYCGQWAPYKEVCLIQHRPKEIHLKNNQLHKDGGPAISYRDGLSLWRLNGVDVPQWLAETKEEDIDPRKLLKIDNAQVRAEFVRKVGIDRVCYSLDAKCVDRQGSYELLMLDLGDGRKRPYLRMQNPSVPELWHVEGVHPSCGTVHEALVWRNGGETEAPTVLT